MSASGIYQGSTDELHQMLERLNHYAEIYKGIDTANSDVFSTYARLVMQRREALKLASLIPLFMVLVDKVGYGTELNRALQDRRQLPYAPRCAEGEILRL